MDEVPPPSDSESANRVGPRCGGGNLGRFSSGRRRRGKAAAPLAVCRGQVRRIWCRRCLGLLGQGLTAINPAAAETAGRATRTRPPCLICGGTTRTLLVYEAATH